MAMVSVQTKLHILLLMLCVGITLYMYILYKEVRGFEKEIFDIKRQVTALSAVSPMPNLQMIGEDDKTSSSAVAVASVPLPPYEDKKPPTGSSGLVYVNDDEVSVTSNEIKEILTNIQDDEDEGGDGDEDTPVSSEPEPEATPAPVAEQKPKDDALANMTDDQIKSMKYDDIRNILRKRGIKFQGNKQEVISQVIKLRDEEKAKSE